MTKSGAVGMVKLLSISAIVIEAAAIATSSTDGPSETSVVEALNVSLLLFMSGPCNSGFSFISSGLKSFEEFRGFTTAITAGPFTA